MKIFLDIETIPLGEEPVYKPAEFPGVKVPSNYKDPRVIEAYKTDNFTSLSGAHYAKELEKYEAAFTEWKKGALKATKSQIVCICAISYDGNQFQSSSDNEGEMLHEFYYWLCEIGASNNVGFVGHNVPFDLQMLRTHAAKYCIHGLVDMLTFEKWAKNIHDTMQLWAGVRYDDKTKLTEIAEFLGIKELNEGTTGADIYDLYKAGKFEEIETKCMNDCLMCKEVYERIC